MQTANRRGRQTQREKAPCASSLRLENSVYQAERSVWPGSAGPLKCGTVRLSGPVPPHQLKRGIVVGRTDRQTHCCNYIRDRITSQHGQCTGPVKTCPSGYMHCKFRLLVFTHDAARGTNDFLWGIFCLQNPTIRAGFRSRNPTVRALVFTHDAAKGTNDFLWGILSLQNPTIRAGFRSQNPTVRAGSASQLKRGTVVGRTDRRTHML